MNKVEEINLGDEAIRYICDRLKFGNTLSKIILKSLDLKKGKVITFLPSDIQVESIKEFYYGGKFINP